MIHDELLQLAHLVLVCHSLYGYHLFVKSLVQIVAHIKYICDTTAHSGCKVLACCSKNYYFTTCHVLTSVIANTLNDRRGTRVTNCKSLAGNTVDECLTTCGTVQCNVSYDDVILMLVLN